MSAQATRTRRHERYPATMLRASCLALAVCGALASQQAKNAVPSARAPAGLPEVADAPAIAVPPSRIVHPSLTMRDRAISPAAKGTLPPPHPQSEALAPIALLANIPGPVTPIALPAEASSLTPDLEAEPGFAGEVMRDQSVVALAAPASIAPPALVAISAAVPALEADVGAGLLPRFESREEQRLAVASIPRRTPIAAVPVAAARIEPAPLRDERAYVAQITDTVRQAYVAQLTDEGTGAQMAVRADGEVLGKIAFQVTDGQVSVRIGQVLDLFEGRFDKAQFARLRTSSAADQFVSLATIQSAGIPLRYDAPYDELVLGSTSG